MVFSSIIFLFLFLPATLGVYYLGGKYLRNVILLTASLFFYAWGEGQYVLLMLASIGVNFIFGLLLDWQTTTRNRKIIISVGVVANLGLLGFYKYADFLLYNFNQLALILHVSPIVSGPTHLPIGISFFTFQAISYIIDVYRQETFVQKNLIHLGLYIASFPQLIAGPIIRYHDVARQIITRTHTLEKFSYGVERFIFGLGKKVLIANVMAEMADYIFNAPIIQLSVFEAWIGILCYAMQIYFDFSGYSDMAIGLGYMFGFRFLENFNYPYISRSIREFWRRWHISLTNWFRDYLYIPLGGNRKGEVRTYLNLLLVFLLCGFWHGASWNFIVWGLFHGFFLALERWRLSRILEKWPLFFQHFYVGLIVLVGWVFFRLEKLSDAVAYLGAMLGIGTSPQINPWVLYKMDSLVFFTLAVAFVGCLPFYPTILDKIGRKRVSRQQSNLITSPGGLVVRISALCLIFILSLLSLASGAYNPFIYFRF
jgi:alginate O-acetyltransferase complex protein AlgI